jgi:DNA-directed RNA polymerase subunit RPC12/RpoP
MVAVGVVLAADTNKAQDFYLLKAPNGGVRLDHKTHSANFKCDQCHHASKPEKPSKSANEACADCHTTPPQAGMKTKLQAAFHNPTGQSGTCIDCHKKQAAAGKKAPTKCTECHLKANG